MAFSVLLGAGVASSSACSSNSSPPPAGKDAAIEFPSDELEISPADVIIDVVDGMPAPPTTFTVTLGGHDVSASASFVLEDGELGTMMGNVLTAHTSHGGSTRLVARFGGGQGPSSVTATVRVKVHGRYTGPDCQGCPTFPADGATACGPMNGTAIVYPPDGVLLPPNLGQLGVHWKRIPSATLYEVNFQNATVDVRITSRCGALVDSRGTPVSDGCALDIDDHWSLVARSSAGSDPVQVSVRASTDGKCATASSNSVGLRIAEEDLVGSIYYWKSKFTPLGTGGDIWTKAFGSGTGEAKLTPDRLDNNFTGSPCWGCHTLSRDGSRMVVQADDSDSDDEYADIAGGLYDVARKSFITRIGYAVGYVPGFQTFNNDHSLILGSDGDGNGLNTAGGSPSGAVNLFWLWRGSDGQEAQPNHIDIGTDTTTRPTMPDWSLDNNLIVYVLPRTAGWADRIGGSNGDDAHIFGGALYTMSVGPLGFEPPVALVESSGDNNYYPSISPDGSWVLYNHVPRQMTASGRLDECTPKGAGSAGGSCPNDSFSNPRARLRVVPPLAGADPIDLANANGSPVSAPVDVSNSWPRWSPFVQKYQGSRLLWITFSSTRDYGLQVRNHVPVKGRDQVQCYPASSAEDPLGAHGAAIAENCQQPQIWMAAVRIDGSGQVIDSDPSYPAFWLPFQDPATHNHTAQWTANVADTGGSCAVSGESCLALPCCPNEGLCLSNGQCGVP